MTFWNIPKFVYGLKVDAFEHEKKGCLQPFVDTLVFVGLNHHVLH